MTEQERPPAVLNVEDLRVHFRPTARARRHGPIRAVDGVDLTVRENEALGIIGESGCGKSTTGRAIVHLTDPTSGRIRYRDEDITRPDRQRRHELATQIQFVFQDPQSSLNPRMTIEEIIAEPLRAFGRWRKGEGRQLASSLLDQVGLGEDALRRYPHEFSGGQRQRIGIARALALDPGLLILDEPVSSLDVSVQAQVLNLLAELRDGTGLSTVMISHDLDVIRHVTDEVAVMYLGVIVESGNVAEVLEAPAHPYTAALASATPPASPTQQRERITLHGELPSAASPPSGCRFHTRCWRADELCVAVQPVLTPFDSGKRAVACHHPLLERAPAPHGA